MWELYCEESCFWIVVLEKTLESPLDCKEIKPVHSKWDQPWIFFGKTDAKAETPILWLPHAKSWLIGKDSDAGRDWGQEEKGTTGWDGWMASLTQWTWVWVNSRSWWWTGRPGVLQFMGSQRVRHDWATELNWGAILRATIAVPLFVQRRPYLSGSLAQITLSGRAANYWPPTPSPHPARAFTSVTLGEGHISIIMIFFYLYAAFSLR